jgi:hypothetical protein
MSVNIAILLSVPHCIDKAMNITPSEGPDGDDRVRMCRNRPRTSRTRTLLVPSAVNRLASTHAAVPPPTRM